MTNFVTLIKYVEPTTHSKSTHTVTQTSFTTVAFPQPTADLGDDDENPINGLPVPSLPATSSKSITPSSSHDGNTFEPPNPTAIPSMFRTKPLTTLATSTLHVSGITIIPLTLTTLAGGTKTFVPIVSTGIIHL